jgi:hypothetical protein
MLGVMGEDVTLEQVEDGVEVQPQICRPRSIGSSIVAGLKSLEIYGTDQ